MIDERDINRALALDDTFCLVACLAVGAANDQIGISVYDDIGIVAAKDDLTPLLWRDGQLVGSIEQPAIAPWTLAHWFDADPSWIIDTLTWEGQGGQVWAVRYETVPEPSTLAMVAAVACLVVAAIYRTRS